MGLGFHAHVVQQAAHGGHVLQAGHVGQCDRLGGQQGRAQLRQGGILGAGDQDLAVQLATPANDEFVHEQSVCAAVQRGRAAHSAGV
jgi:hypothetical protein